MLSSARTTLLAGLLAVTASVASAQSPIAPCPMGPVPPGPIPGEHPTPSCRIGDFEFVGYTDIYSPIGPFNMSWSFEFHPTRIDLALRMIGSSVTLTTPTLDPIDRGLYPFFEYRLYYRLHALTPTARVFHAALTDSSGVATFSVPEYSYSGPWATWGMGFNTHYGATWGSLEANAYFENYSDQPIVATFRDVSLSASIWLDQPVTPVPEPATIALLGSGLAALGLVRLRTRRRTPEAATTSGGQARTPG